MICITDATRLTAESKCKQIAKFIDKVFVTYNVIIDPEILDAEMIDLEEEWKLIKNG